MKQIYQIVSGSEILADYEEYLPVLHWLWKNADEYELRDIKIDYTLHIPSKRLISYRVVPIL